MIRSATCLLAGLATACGSAVGSDEPEIAETLTVEQALDASCETNIVDGLSRQLLDAMSCLSPGMLAPIGAHPNVGLDPPVWPVLQPPARDAFERALASQPHTWLSLRSATRTIAQQYLAHVWKQRGTCGVKAARSPGASDHELGLAVDVGEWKHWLDALRAQGWTWAGSADTV